MPLSSGTKLSHYEIVAPLGVGGMGEVYRARDSRLSRDVAIKILPSDLSSNADRVRRFEQEAQSASALNHPNIITIYDIGTADSHFFIAMEFVDGKTLREMLAAGPIAPRKAAHIAAQIAEGLAKAHEAGIIHRDLKPENIMVSSDGYVKILDFGLAKLFLPVVDDQVSVLPTSAHTDAGTILGTVGYMSPEQASGSEIQFQSDQFSFGAILYEMLTGKRAFQKKTTVETMAAIINQEPEPITSSGNHIPPPIRWVIERCLEKNPADRYASTRDLARDLSSIREHFSEVATSTELPVATVGMAPSSKRKRHRILDVAAVLLIAILAAVSFYFWKASNTVETKPVSYHRLTYRRGTINSSRFAPDGQTIIYSASFEGQERGIYQTRTERFESSSLGISNADVLSISKSGEMLILIRKDKNVLAQVPITGGLPRELAEDIFGADYAPDGNEMALSRLKQGRWYLEYPTGKALYESGRLIDSIRFSPRGDRIAFDEHDSGGSNGVIKIVDLAGKQIAVSKEFYPNGVAWDSTGTEVWFTTLSDEAGGGDELHAISTSGAMRLVTRFATARIHDISSDGRLLIHFADVRGSLMAAVDGEKSERELSWLDQPEVRDFSPDGKTVLIHERGAGSESPSGTIFVRSMDGSPAVRLASGSPSLFSPDGKWVLGNLGSIQILLVPVGPGNARNFKFDELKNIFAIDFLPEGQDILFGGDQNDQRRLYTVKLSGSEPKAITKAGVFETAGKTISPNGKFVLGRDSEGSLQLYPVAGGDPKPLQGVQPREEIAQWSQDSNSVFVFNPTTFPLKVVRVDVATGARELFKEIVPPDPVGITGFSSVRFAPDEKTYAYSFVRSLGTLYLLNGVK